MSTESREHYHHGDLKSALIAAAVDIIQDEGIEEFSLRKATRKAGVSPGAPMHHFGGVVGLLTQVAIRGFNAMAQAIAAVPLTGHATRDLYARAEAYIRYARDHPGMFRLMGRKDLIDYTDPNLQSAGFGAVRELGRAASAYTGIAVPDGPNGGPPPGLFAIAAATHGLAHMAIEDRWSVIFGTDDPDKELFERFLPSTFAALWPERG